MTSSLSASRSHAWDAITSRSRGGSDEADIFAARRSTSTRRESQKFCNTDVSFPRAKAPITPPGGKFFPVVWYPTSHVVFSKGGVGRPFSRARETSASRPRWISRARKRWVFPEPLSPIIIRTSESSTLKCARIGRKRFKKLSSSSGSPSACPCRQISLNMGSKRSCCSLSAFLLMLVSSQYVRG